MDYLFTFFLSFLLSFIFTFLFRKVAIKLSILDYPNSDIKTHQTPTPYLGGLAIAFAFFIVLFLVRFTTNFPTGTLRALRGIIFGSFIILIIGIIDDFKYRGIHFTTKFVAQIIAAVIAIFYGIKIEFITPQWFSILVTLIWIVGITNAINLIDVMDGLASGLSFLICVGFFIITNYIQEEVYVSYASISLAGSILGFMPYNLSKKYKIFMGDTGSLFIGFILSNISLGTKYSLNNNLAVLAPIIILLIPIYETFLISALRISKGKSPFLGSKDHYALRLKIAGFKEIYILLISYFLNIFLLVLSIFLVIAKSIFLPIVIILTILILIFLITKYLVNIQI